MNDFPKIIVLIVIPVFIYYICPAGGKNKKIKTLLSKIENIPISKKAKLL